MTKPMHRTWVLAACLAAAGAVHAQAGDGQPRTDPAKVATPTPATAPALDDGPYLRYEPGRVTARWVCDGMVVERAYPARRWPVVGAPQCG